jgi:Zn-dependent peptidase ImmA (M78 family)
MYRSEYYKKLKDLAGEVRETYCVQTDRFGLAEMRRIYRAEGIRIDMRTLTGRKIRAAYFCDSDDPCVLLRRNMPPIPRLFSLGHELKHHYCDRQAINTGKFQCGDYNAHEMIEIGAEIFSAELIYPEAEFLALASELGLVASDCTEETIVRFKHACPAQISYKFLLKRLEWFEIIPKGAFARVQFQKLEERIFGAPIYKQDWFIRRRARRTSR